jgi:sugar lactone lactonase YvrE
VSQFRGVRWQPPAPSFPVPRRSDRRTLPHLSFVPLPGRGAEHIVVDGHGRLLTGLEDGRIVRLNVVTGRAELIAETGGRPLGLELYGSNSLVVCDADRGLLRVALDGSGRVEVLCDAVEGQRLVFCSCPAVATDGTIYFSQSSQRYDLAHYKGDLLEHSGTGRVIRYRGGAVEVVASGLSFANGVVLSPDESALYVAETGGYCVTRIVLETGETTPLIGDLPGFPDNLTMSAGGLIWIAMASPRDALLDFLLPRPAFLRSLVWSLPDRLRPDPKDIAWALAVSPDGKVVHDLRGWNVGYHEVTAVREHEGKLYLCSLAEPTIACADLPGAVSKSSGGGHGAS